VRNKREVWASPLLRGGVAAPHNVVTLPKTQRGRGGQTLPKHDSASALPVCAAKERDHFVNGAATPPQGGGDAAILRVCSGFLIPDLFQKQPSRWGGPGGDVEFRIASAIKQVFEILNREFALPYLY